ncbi:class I adenylate-forming enzyme family protein [Bacillus sp. Marseille-P3661]|uniref:class I adenylate-forming enzyme family protein n=1 Tax=Bacillus sp. Marseille-P3661 TaxID=1936234 RepID=UPI000C84F953|nr:class I adenylate-forming enzyme family protein [Bacillus sp. Marseille-P3661]
MNLTVDLNSLSVYGLLKRAALGNGNKEALFDLSSRVSYEKFKYDIDQVAAVLSCKGIQKGDRVALSLPNWYETATIFFATAKIGAILVPFNPNYKSHELNHILTNSEPKAIFISDKLIQNIGIKEIQTMVNLVITVRTKSEQCDSYEDWMALDVPQIVETDIEVANDLYCILYTSGTTGVPKGVMVTHQSVVQSANTLASSLQCSEKDVFIIAAPLFHIFGMACNLFCSVSSGARMVLMEKYEPRKMLQVIEQEKVTIQQGVPTMFLKELELDDFDNYDLSTLRAGMVGASPIPPHKVKEIRDRFGMNLCQSFGITETATVTMTPYHDSEDKITQTLGLPIPGVELKIVDENRVEVEPGQTGEIAIKSFGNMKGYYKMPEETSKVLADGWYYTGDLGTLDNEGYLYFIGRKKEMIIRGGFNVYPQEIEEVLKKHETISEVAVVGLPDEVLGEIVCAVIKLKEGKTSNEEEILQFLKGQIANYKLPQKVVFATDFPVTASGKIQKMKLREQIVEQLRVFPK